MEDLEKIKDRIAKLLRMAEDASSPNEAAIAAGRARRLMDKHQLDLFDVGNRIEEEFGMTPATRFYAAIPTHIDVLAVAVAQYNDCQARIQRGPVEHKLNRKRKLREDTYRSHGKRVVFLGYKSDTELAVQMLDRLFAAINRLCKDYLTSKGHKKYPVNIGMQFKTGASSAIMATLKSLTAERDALMNSGDPGTSLMVIKKKNVDENFGETDYKDVSFKKQESEEEDEARRIGHIKGASIEIVTRVSDESEDEPLKELE